MMRRAGWCWLILLMLCACEEEAPPGAPTPSRISEYSALKEIQDRGTLKVAMEAEFPPFEYRTEKGEVVGFDVELAGELAESLGVELEIVETKWDSIIASLQTGKVDLIISGMTATLKRARTISFSKPYLKTALCLLCNEDSGIESYRDCNREGVVLAIKQGTTGETVAQREFPKATLKFFTSEADCALEVSQGKADAFVYDQVSIVKHGKNYPDTTYTLLEPISREPYAIGFRQGNPDLGRYLDQFISTLQDDGRMQHFYDAHLKEAFGDD